MAKVDARSYSVQGLLKAHLLHIPYYQRPYVWDDAAVKLLDDIQDAFERREPGDDEGYFIGNILLIRSDVGADCDFDLADGQQRLTTLLIILGQLQALVLATAAASAYHKDAAYARDFILTHCTAPGVVITGIQSPHEEVQALLSRLVQGAVVADRPTGRSASVGYIGSRMVHAYTRVSEQVNDWFRSHKRLRVGEFLNYILNQVEMVVIKYPNPSVALEFFESLNSKGTALVQADLLKSAFMKQVPPSKWEAVDADWSEILKVVGHKKDGEDGFLRTASMAVLFPAFKTAAEAPRKSELLSRISKHCRDESVAVDGLLAKMSAFAKNRAAVLSEVPTYPGGASGRVLARIRRLPKLPDFLVTLVAVMPNDLSLTAKEHLAKTFEALACVVAISRESKNINYAVQPYCVKLRNLGEHQVSEFCSELVAALVRPNLASFYNQFKLMDASAKHKAWVRYLLWVVEDYLRDGLGRTRLDYSDKQRGARKAHLEHIIPQSKLGDYPAGLLHQIGNMTLLEPAKNTSIGAGTYLTKRTQYAGSEFCITAELSGHDHGGKTGARMFLDGALIRPVWDYPTFGDTDVELRTEAVYELLLAYWGISLTESPPKVESADEPVATAARPRSRG